METKFLAWLTRVKAKTLSRIGSGSRVRSVPGWITGLRHFPNSGAVGLAGLCWVTARVRRVRVAGLFGLAGLSSGKAKTSPRAGFSLIPQLGLVSWVNWFRSARSGYARLGLYPLNPDRVNFPFLKSFINSNHFDSN
jgi:hypothetical protein